MSIIIVEWRSLLDRTAVTPPTVIALCLIIFSL